VEGNLLYYGDNLDMLRDHIGPGTVDLIYLDPPFNSNRVYNVIYKEHSGEGSQAQITAFDDTWKWSPEADRIYEGLLQTGPNKVADAVEAVRRLLGPSDLTAYLMNMTVRLKELHRVLKPTGSLYLHCDPTASHYLKIMLDAIFGPDQFRSEIIWRRTGAHGKSRRFAPIHDTILFYTKSNAFKWTNPKRPYMKGHVEEYFEQAPQGTWRTKYYGNVLTGSGLRGGESGKPWRGIDPSKKGRHWAIPGVLIEDLDESFEGMTQHEKLDRLFDLGFITIDPKDAWPMYQRTLKPGDGTSIPDIWAYQPYTGGTVWGTDKGIDDDVRWLSTKDRERLGYQTQKPVALLERIIAASSEPGDVVLDPFCGCGTAVVAAERLDRRWVGIDITYLAIDLIQKRLTDEFQAHPVKYSTEGVPRDITGARALFSKSPFDFERWAVSMAWGTPNEKQVGDRGIDGVIRFPMGQKAAHGVGRVLLSVKGGGTVPPTFARDLLGTVNGQGAEMGLLIVFEKPTKGLLDVAATAGNYEWPVNLAMYPKLQIMTVTELLDGKRPNTPPPYLPYMKAKGQPMAAMELPFEYGNAEQAEETYMAAEGGPDEPYGESDSN
jgi:site-specific DNA-methyltransferase (adenine-specific)